MKNKKLFNLSFCAIMIALGTVLSLVALFKLPLGGTVTLCSMLPIMLIGYFLGTKWGVLSAFVFSLIQVFISLGDILSWGLSTTVLVASLFLDYIFAYTVLGFSGMFAKGGKDKPFANKLLRFVLGMLAVVLIRFAFHIVSGVALFSSWATFQPVWLYSIVYNGSFLAPDFGICVVIGVLSFKPVSKLMAKKTAE